MTLGSMHQTLRSTKQQVYSVEPAVAKVESRRNEREGRAGQSRAASRSACLEEEKRAEKGLITIQEAKCSEVL